MDEGVGESVGVGVGEAAGVKAASGLKVLVKGRWRGCEFVPALLRLSDRSVCV